MPMASWLTLESFILVDGDRFPGGQEVYLIFNSDIVKVSLKNHWGRDK